MQRPVESNRPGQRPDWLRVKLPYGDTFREVQKTIESHGLHTVCSSARCPNMGECWTAGTATFMILGNVCTRSCSFCAVLTGRPEQKDLDWDEPRRVEDAAGADSEEIRRVHTRIVPTDGNPTAGQVVHPLTQFRVV